MSRLALVALGGTLLLAAGAQQDGPPRYVASMLADAAFDQRVRAEVRTQAGGAARTEQVSREARLRFRASGITDSLVVEAWFDSLVIWREGPEGRVTPDPDPVIGGRYRGVLASNGKMTVHTRPFVPDDLMEVSDVGEVMNDFLPRVPSVALVAGAVWEAEGFRIVRRTDSAPAGVRLHRYRWSRVQADTAEQGLTDSLRYLIRSHLEEEGNLVWHPSLGPLVWHRQSTMSMEIPADGAVRRSARTRMTEESWVWRRLQSR